MIRLKERFTFHQSHLLAGGRIFHHQDHFHVMTDGEPGFISLRDDFQKAPFKGVLKEEHLRPKAFCSLNDQLVLIPSGQKKYRSEGAIVSLSDYAVKELSFRNVFDRLETHFPELNIQGAVVIGKTIRLFHKGSRYLRQHAMIDLHLDAFLEDRVKDLRFLEVELEKLGVTPLSFCDACLYQRQIIFLAVAETAESANHQGHFIGAVIGRMDLSGRILKTLPLKLSAKPEAFTIKGEEFFLVTDHHQKDSPGIYSGELLHLFT